MYLIDTNVWLHRLLDHDHSRDVKELLDSVPPTELLMTDFTLHSLGIILDRLGRHDVFLDFVRDVLIDGGVEVVSIGADRMGDLYLLWALKGWISTMPINTWRLKVIRRTW